MSPGAYPQHCLIATALATSPTGEQRVTEIYERVQMMFPSVPLAAPNSWKNSLRHSLSKSGYFVMVNKSANPVLAARKNHYWKIDPTRAVDLLSSMDKHYNRIIATHSILRGVQAPLRICNVMLAKQLLIDNQAPPTAPPPQSLSYEATKLNTDDCLQMMSSLLEQKANATPLVTSEQIQVLIQQSSDDQWLCNADINDLVTPDTRNVPALNTQDLTTTTATTVPSADQETEEDNNDQLMPTHEFTILMDLKVNEEESFNFATASSSSQTGRQRSRDSIKLHSSRKRCFETDDQDSSNELELLPHRRMRLV